VCPLSSRVRAQPARARVTLQLFADPKLAGFGVNARVIECRNAETMRLVYRTIQEVRNFYAELLVKAQLAAAAR